MDDKLKPYLLAVLLNHIADRQTQVDKGYLSKSDTLAQIEFLLDGLVSSDKLEWTIGELGSYGVFSKISDELAGEFFKINPTAAINEISAKNKDVDSLIYKYRSVGPKFLSAVIEKLQKGGSDVTGKLPLESPILVPAADRVVKLDHNQVSSFDDQISELVEELEGKDNGDPDHPGLRERILGQIKAGRELIRAGEFRAYLLYEVLVRALGELIEKYANPTIKALADALLGAIASQILES